MRLTMDAHSEDSKQSALLIIAGIFLGLGLGGFVDGILLHQILQWHHMLSSVKPLTTVSNIDLNMVWDGLFDALDWVMTVIGVVLLWWVRRSDNVSWTFNTYFGSIFIGAGLFNLIEGVIDHHVLGIHHVKPGPNQLTWDLGFLAVGALLVVIGSVMIQQKRKG
jgi:uncharacterized membrane protein